MEAPEPPTPTPPPAEPVPISDAGESSSPERPDCIVFVGNLPEDVTDSAVSCYFSRYSMLPTKVVLLTGTKVWPQRYCSL